MEGGIRGLVIVFSAFMIQVLSLGNSACIGIYTVHFLQAFNEDSIGVSLISSIHIIVLFGLGPVTSMIMTTIAYRKLCLVGSALVSLGMFFMYLFPRLEAMYIFFGVFCGLGGLLVYLPSHVLCGLYYDKHRTLSTGIAAGGMAMGALIMPLVVGLLIEEYTWQGSLLILSGLQLHLFIFSMFMIPPEDTVLKNKIQSRLSLLVEKASSEQNVNSESKYDFISNDPMNNDMSAQMTKSSDNEMTLVFISNNAKETADIHSRVRAIDSDQIDTRVDSADISLSENGGGSDTEDYFGHDNQTESYQGLDKELKSRYGECNKCELNSIMSKDNRNHQARPSTVRSHIKSHLLVFTDFNCVLYLISTFIWAMTSTLFLTFGPDHIYKQGHSAKNTAFIFTFYGFGQLVGCILISIIGNFVGCRIRIILFSVSALLTGMCYAIVPLVYTFSEFAIILTCSGLPYGAILGLSFIVVVDILGPEKMEIGLAFVLLAMGAGSFVGPPVGGFLENTYGHYDEAIYLSGVLTAVAGLIVLCFNIPVPKFKAKRKREKQTSDVNFK